MPPVPIPGLGEIQAWAAFCGIDITGTVQQLTQILEVDPDSIWNGSDQLGGVAGGLESEQGDVNQPVADVLASGMVGQTADAIGQVGAELTGQVAGAAQAARQLAGKLGQMATSFAENKSAVLSLTGATAAALGMLRT